MSGARPPRVFRGTGALVLLILTAVVAAALLVDAAVRSGLGNALLLAPWPLLVVWTVWVVGVASDVRADQAGVQVQNLLRRISVPWHRVKRMTMRWQLEIAVDDGSVVRCFGGPARSRPRRLGPDRGKEHSVAETDDGIAALNRLRAQAAEAGSSAGSGAKSDATIVRTWDWTAIIVLAVLVVWAIAAVSITR